MATGEVVAAMAASDLRVAGDAVHTAARIQQAAEPGQVLISTRTARAARDLVVTGPPRRIVARGKQRPVEVVEVTGMSTVPAPVSGMVDRDEELPTLLQAVHRAAEHGRLVLLVGEAGVGKTTLVRAVADRLGDEVQVLWGRCLPEWQSLPFWPVREVLAAAAGVPVSDPAGTLAEAITALVTESWTGPVAEAATTAAAVCRLIGLEAPGEHPGEHPDRGNGHVTALNEVGARELAAALAGVLCRLAARERTVIVLEDLHWASRDLLDVAAILVSGGCPPHSELAFLATTRPEPPVDPLWLERTGARRIDLGCLPERSTAALLRGVLGGDADLSADLVAQVQEASQGNPLFVKELGLALREDRGAVAGARLPIPDSLRALIAARLDRLSPSSKRALCRAAVIGRWFTLESLAALSDGDADGTLGLDGDLARLLDGGLIERVPDWVSGQPGSFAFQHTLFREVAYELLPKATRSELHRRLADHLAGGGQQAREAAPPELVAPHLVAAVRLAGQIRTPTAADQQLAARAVRACRLAAERLRDQEALASAARMLDDALALVGVAGTPPPELAELWVRRGALHAVIGDPTAAIADLRAAAAAEQPAVRAVAFTELSDLYGRLNEFDHAADAADRALTAAAQTGRADLLARALRVKAQEPYLAGNLRETERLLEEALRHARDGGHHDLAIEVQSTLLPVRLQLATPLATIWEEALSLAAAARAAGRRNAEAGASFTLGEVAALQGDLEQARRHYERANQQRSMIGLTLQRLWSLLGLVQVAVLRGDAASARRLAAEAIELTAKPDGGADPEAELHNAEACLAGDPPDLEAASAAVARAWRCLQEGDVLSRARLQRTEALLASLEGRHGEAVALLERALATLAPTGYRLERLRTRVSLVATLRRAGGDQNGQADALAGEALAEARAIGARRLVRELTGAVRAAGKVHDDRGA
jgi:tetratricopeptide (TPR) repeat protein/energy-coupling factor transporter ATP-binding protein EcfA2